MVGRLVINDDLERSGRDLIEVLPGICQEELRKIAMNLSQHTRCPGGLSNEDYRYANLLGVNCCSDNKIWGCPLN
jgi:glycerol-3-phosphate responsive antiterminator